MRLILCQLGNRRGNTGKYCAKRLAPRNTRKWRGCGSKRVQGQGPLMNCPHVPAHVPHLITCWSQRVPILSFEMRNCLLSTFSRSKQPAACNRNLPPDTFSMGDALLFLSLRAPSLYFNPVHDARRIPQDLGRERLIDIYQKKKICELHRSMQRSEDEEYRFITLEKGILYSCSRRKFANS